MPKFNAIILAGGQSRRMGENKAFLPFGDSTFIQSIIQMLQPFAERIIISGSKNKYQNLGCEVIEDEIFNGGPLSGIYSGLKKTDLEWNFVISVDTPFVNGFIIKKLQEQIKAQDFDVVAISTKQKNMPLVGMYNKSCIPTLEGALYNGHLKVTHVLNKLKTNFIMIQEPYNDLLTNINTPQEYNEGLTTILVRFFGQLAELTGIQEAKFALPSNATIQQVKHKVFQEYKGLENKTYKVALNNCMAKDSDQLTKEAKVDFLPAFAGG